MTTTAKKSKRGFASMSKEKLHEICSKGGKAAHEQGTAHKFKAGSEEASRAGRKGGRIGRKKPRQTQEA